MTLTKKKLKGGAQKVPKTPKAPGRVGKFFRGIFNKKSKTSKAPRVNVIPLKTVRLGHGASLASTQTQNPVTLSANHPGRGPESYNILNLKTRTTPVETPSSVYSVLQRPGPAYAKIVAATRTPNILNGVASKYDYSDFGPASTKPSFYTIPYSTANSQRGPPLRSIATGNIYSMPNRDDETSPKYAFPRKILSAALPVVPPKVISYSATATAKSTTNVPIINPEKRMGVKLQTYESLTPSQKIQSAKTTNLVIPSSSGNPPLRDRKERGGIRRVDPATLQVVPNPSYVPTISLNQPKLSKPLYPQAKPTFQMSTEQSHRIQKIIANRHARSAVPFGHVERSNPLYNNSTS